MRRSLFIFGVLLGNCFGQQVFNNYVAYTGQDIIQWPAVVPNVGTYVKTGGLVYDTSYVGHQGFSAGNLSPAIRCTDTLTEPTLNYNKQHTAGIGGSGSAILWNQNSTLMRVNGGTSGEMIPFATAMAASSVSG